VETSVAHLNYKEAQMPRGCYDCGLKSVCDLEYGGGDVPPCAKEAAPSASTNTARKEILFCSYTGFCLANQHGICTDVCFCNCQRKTSSVA
jgi:hypothetical protein